LQLIAAAEQRIVDTRVAKAIEKRVEEALKIGHGVSAEAQIIFDALAKTYGSFTT
jgi:hypothetical protein